MSRNIVKSQLDLAAFFHSELDEVRRIAESAPAGNLLAGEFRFLFGRSLPPRNS